MDISQSHTRTRCRNHGASMDVLQFVSHFRPEKSGCKSGAEQVLEHFGSAIFFYSQIARYW